MAEIRACRICHSPNLTDVFDMGSQVLASRFPSKNEPDPPTAPLILCKCMNGCGLVQLRHTVSSDELYTSNYGYRSGLNEMMRSHLKTIVDDLYSYSPPVDGDLVLDIGSNDGTLLSHHSNVTMRVGIDPTGKQFAQYYDSSITLIPEFFTSSAFGDRKAKYITSISMFYDLPSPMDFMKDISRVLRDDGIWIMEQSYMPTMLLRDSYDTVCHEHLEYYTLAQIQWMCERADLVILNVSLNDCNGGSFRVTITHKESKYPVNREAINAIMEMEKSLDIEEFVKRCETHRTELVSLLKSIKERGESIYVYGASTKGNTMLQYCNIDSSIITAAVERNPMKYGCRTPKTNIPIIPEDFARAAHPDYMLVLPWHFREGIIARENDYLKHGGKLIFPLPSISVVSA